MKTLFLSCAGVLLLVATSGCTDPVEAAENVAAECGQRACPIGTAPQELRSIKAGTDITAGIDPANYTADGAFKRFGEGDCEYACVVMDPCDEGTFPVITETCFTCGTLNAEGELVYPDCG